MDTRAIPASGLLRFIHTKKTCCDTYFTPMVDPNNNNSYNHPSKQPANAPFYYNLIALPLTIVILDIYDDKHIK